MVPIENIKGTVPTTSFHSVYHATVAYHLAKTHTFHETIRHRRKVMNIRILIGAQELGVES
ncbi:hypothetical protein K438DRAFT_1816681 [Mycena galopus ATCC 62051]|nr:hypothetical protein K438DRAFT_1816681 [Mycena galopus ATCC 62051]